MTQVINSVEESQSDIVENAISNIQNIEVNMAGIDLDNCSFTIDMKQSSTAIVAYAMSTEAEQDSISEMIKAGVDTANTLIDLLNSAMEGVRLPAYTGKNEMDITIASNIAMSTAIANSYKTSIKSVVSQSSDNTQTLKFSAIGLRCKNSNISINQEMQSDLISDSIVSVGITEALDSLYDGVVEEGYDDCTSTDLSECINDNGLTVERFNAAGQKIKETIAEIQKDAIRVNKTGDITMIVLIIVGIIVSGVLYHYKGTSKEANILTGQPSMTNWYLFVGAATAWIVLVVVIWVVWKNNLPWYHTVSGFMGTGETADGKLNLDLSLADVS